MINLYLPRTKDLLLPGPGYKLRGRVRPQVFDARTGVLLHDQGWRDNLILDAGLDMIASNLIANCFKYGHLGTGSGAVSAANTTLKVWGKRTAVYGNGDGATTFNGDTITFQRSFLFSAETGAVTFSEFGTSPTNVDNAPLFNRVVLTPLTLGSGQQAKITLAVDVTLSPHTTSQVYGGDVITGWPGSSGQGRIVSKELYFSSVGSAYQYYFSKIASDGTNPVTGSGGQVHWLEIPTLGSVLKTVVSTSSAMLPAVDTANGYNGFRPSGDAGLREGNTPVLQAYVPGSCSRMKTFVADLNHCNLAAIRSIGIAGSFSHNSSTISPTWVYQFVMDNAFTKANTHRLTLNFNYSWGRAA